MKDWNAKSASLSNGSSSSLSLTRYGYFRINAQFEMELIKGRWKMKAIADQVLPDL